MSIEAFEPEQDVRREKTEALSLPESLDRDTTIFAYGSLLDRAKLQELVGRNRGGFEIQETSSIEQASKVVAEHPNDVVILHGAQLDDVRVSVVSDAELRKWYAGQGRSVDEAIVRGVWPPEIQKYSFLHAHPAGAGEKGRFLNGGLVIGLTETDLTKEIDPFEIPPVYVREPVPKLTIDGQAYIPKHITFYSAGIPEQRRDPKESAASRRYSRAKTFDGSGKVITSEYSQEAKWPEGVRSGKTKAPKPPQTS